MRRIVQSNRFKRQAKLARKRGRDLAKLETVVRQLAVDAPLAPKHKDHKLTGNFQGCRECHLEPDWLLVYRLTADNGLELVETGSHSDLF